jgi:Do/DeqQ family serine protease
MKSFNNATSVFISCQLLVLFLFQSCQAQESQKDIDQMQKNVSTLPVRNYSAGIVDFRFAAKLATPGVVNIKSSYKQTIQQNKKENDFDNLPDPFKDFFNDDDLFFRQFKFQTPPLQPSATSGSGVILSNDGYIITNNHVIKEADEINITLYDGRSYDATVIGTDSQTDLALLKIDEKNLSFIQFGKSDSVEVGEWVVAVGNPFNLASTVTAGIVSAKARNINILQDQGAIESFIQTDAAVNPGNSGGALVNLDGKLVGINTAIATPTGVYAGYAFAIPSDIVKKVVNDLLNYGAVQRGILGVKISNLNSELAKELKINRANGVYVDSVMNESAAKEAGIKAKDVIVSIDNEEIINASKLQELIARKHPGEKVRIGLIRNRNVKMEIVAVLKNSAGNTEIIKDERNEVLKTLGIELTEITKEDKKNYTVKNGVKVTKITSGKISRNTDIHPGFVITSVNKVPVYSVESFIEEMKKQKGGVMLEGKYENDLTIYYYAFGN